MLPVWASPYAQASPWATLHSSTPCPRAVPTPRRRLDSRIEPTHTQPSDDSALLRAARASLCPAHNIRTISAPPLHAPLHHSFCHHACNRSMPGPRFAMLVHLAMTLSTVHGWALPSDNKTSSLSSNESAITGGADGARDSRQLEGFWDRADGIEPRFQKIRNTPTCTGSCDEGILGCDTMRCNSAQGGYNCRYNCDGFFGWGGCDDDCDSGCLTGCLTPG